MANPHMVSMVLSVSSIVRSSSMGEEREKMTIDARSSSLTSPTAGGTSFPGLPRNSLPWLWCTGDSC